MIGVTTVLILGIGVLPPAALDGKPGSAGAEAFHQLAAEFDQARRAGAAPDVRQYVRRFLDLARETKDEDTAADALVWVARRAGRTAERVEAIERIGERYIQSDHIAGACRPIAATGESGERLLRRIVDENPHPAIRGQACLGLVSAARMRLLETRRYQATGADQRDAWVKALGEARVDQLDRVDPAALVADSERWLERAVKEFPAAARNPEVSDFFPVLSNDPGPSAEAILQRAADEHPDAGTRIEARCALLVQRMKLAGLVAEAAGGSAGERLARSAQDVPGGAARIMSVEPGPLAVEIDRGLQGLADRVEDWPRAETPGLAQSGIKLYHLLSAMATNQAFHAGAERLLRRVAEAHPDDRVRSTARRSLALHLAGLAEASARLQFAAGADRAYWAALLGDARLERVKELDAAKLTREARELAEQVAAERGSATDRDIKALLQTSGNAAVGMVAPEIEGEDIHGERFNLGDYRGKVVLLDFWNHQGCAPCRDAYPTLRALAEDFQGRPFSLLGVNIGDDRNELAQLVERGELTWRFWFTHGTEDEPTFARWRIGGVPGVVLIDHRGIVRVRHLGSPSKETLESTIKALLQEVEDKG